MRVYVRDGKAQLEDVSAEELMDLFTSLEIETNRHFREAMAHEEFATKLEEAARTASTGRRKNRRRAGEIRQDAAHHRALQKRGQDILRALAPVVDSPDLK